MNGDTNKAASHQNQHTVQVLWFFLMCHFLHVAVIL